VEAVAGTHGQRESPRRLGPSLGVFSAALVALLVGPATASAAGATNLSPHPASVVPFAALLLAVALLPLVADTWWHHNRNKAVVAAALAIPAAVYLLVLDSRAGGAALWDVVEEYAAFIFLLGALYTVSGGVVLRGELRATPARNTAVLGFGAVLANVVGTTGASMLLIRPFLRMNRGRTDVPHLVVFFIFLVSNLGGLLTPLGDPPLFLGFLNDVPFFWTLRLWRQWLVTNLIVLAVFYVWEVTAFRSNPPALEKESPQAGAAFGLVGRVNIGLLVAVLAVVLLESQAVGQAVGTFLVGRDLTLGPLAGGLVLCAIGLISLAVTPAGLRSENAFTWGPITEVAIIFAGLFVTMVPALALLKQHGASFGLTEPWQYFWLTGILSSMLDNAPTYLAFGTVAAGSDSFRALATDQPQLLAAISCGAVFMGALTYIGNGPNFMVKAIAEDAGVPAPSFFGYAAYSGVILLPLFALVTWLFFLR
jgi:Na+/H+ antiporter NhaD/arsenite permease-like protein